MQETLERIKLLGLTHSQVYTESGIGKSTFYRLIKGCGGYNKFLELNRYLNKKESENKEIQMNTVLKQMPSEVKVTYDNRFETFFIINNLSYYKMNYSKINKKFYITCNHNLLNQDNKSYYYKETDLVFKALDLLNTIDI